MITGGEPSPPVLSPPWQVEQAAAELERQADRLREYQRQMAFSQAANLMLGISVELRHRAAALRAATIGPTSAQVESLLTAVLTRFGSGTWVGDWRVRLCIVPDGLYAEHRSGGEWFVVVGSDGCGRPIDELPEAERLYQVLSEDGIAPPPLAELFDALTKAVRS